MYQIKNKRQNRIWIFSITSLVLAMMLVFGQGPVQAFQGRATPTPTKAVGQQPDAPAIRITVDESYLNKLVIDALEEDESLSRPVVNLHPPDRVEVTASFLVRNSFTVRPTVILELDVVNGQVQTIVRDFDINSVPIPRSLIADQLDELTTRMEREINQELVAELDQSGLELVDVSATNHSLIIDLDDESLIE